MGTNYNPQFVTSGLVYVLDAANVNVLQIQVLLFQI
jgi:hypothetical protein